MQASSVSVATLVRDWQSEDARLAPVDRQRGLLVLRYCAAGSSCDSSAFLHCGESLERATSVLRDDLVMRQRYAGRTLVYRCDELLCAHEAMMEGDYRGTLRFDAGSAAPVLVEVLHVEGEASADALAVWTSRTRAEYQARTCDDGGA